MTLKSCLEIGLDCGLETVGKSIYNMEIHALNIFEYSKINQELLQIYREATDVFNKTNFTKESLTREVLDWINSEDDGVDEKKLNL